MNNEANNRKVLEPFSKMDANAEHIFSRTRKRIEAMRLVAIFLKRKRQDTQKAQANIELYLDDWIYHHGPIDYLPSKEHPQGGPIFQNALADCADRIQKQQQAKDQMQEDAEFRQMQGSLGDGFDDGPFQGLPDDAAFEKAILKQRPELKRK